MSQMITLELPESVIEQARIFAERTHRPVASILSDWLNRFVEDFPLEVLTDEEILTLCDSWMENANQEELSELLSLQQEGQLSDGERQRLEILMQLYRQGMVRKAKALKIAVARGLRNPLN